MFDLSQEFFFEAAHTLRRDIETESSRRIHGHTYTVVVTVRGKPDPQPGMVVDLGYLRREIDRVRDLLDHRFLDEIEALQTFGPPTVENLCRFIANEFRAFQPSLYSVRISRTQAGDSCCYYPLEV